MSLKGDIAEHLICRADPAEIYGPLPQEGWAIRSGEPMEAELMEVSSFVFSEPSLDIISPGQTLDKKDLEERKLSIGRKLMERASHEDEYESRMELLAQAGAIFSCLGCREDAYRVHFMMVQLADETGRTADAAFHRAVAAMGEGDENGVIEELKIIPDGYEGRDILANFVESRKVAGRMAATFAAASALAAAHLAGMDESEGSFVGKLLGVGFKRERESLSGFLNHWLLCLQSGRFDSSAEIIEEIWRVEPGARHGISMLAGLPGPEAGDVADLMEKRWSDHLSLGDLLNLEKENDAGRFVSRLEFIAANAGTEGASEIAAVTHALRQFPEIAKPVERFISKNFEDRPVSVSVREMLKGSLDPANVAIMIGGFALARLTTTAVMSKLTSAGLGGLSFAGKAATFATEIGVEAAAFTFYHRALTSALTSQRVDWGAGQFARDFATLALSFGFLRAANVPLAVLKGKMLKAPARWAPGDKLVFPRAQSAAGWKAKSAYAVAENLLQATAFYAGSQTAYVAGIADKPRPFFEQWLTLVEFQLGIRVANRVSGGWVSRKARDMQVKSVLAETDRIARKFAEPDPMIRGPLARQLALAHIKGKLSSADLLSMRKVIKTRAGDSPEFIREANALLKKAGIDLVYDGFYLSVPEKPEGSLSRKRAQAQLKPKDLKKSDVAALSLGVLDLGEITKQTAFGTVHDNLTDMLTAKEVRGEGRNGNLLLAGPGNGNLANQLYRWFGSALAIHRWDSSHLKSDTFLQPKLYDRIIAMEALRGIEPIRRLGVVARLVDSLAGGGEIIFTLPSGGKDPFTASIRNPSAKLMVALKKSGYTVTTTTRQKDGATLHDVLIRKNFESDVEFGEVYSNAIRSRLSKKILKK